MAGPLTAEEIDLAVAQGHLDPILGNAMKAKMAPAALAPGAAPGALLPNVPVAPPTGAAPGYANAHGGGVPPMAADPDLATKIAPKPGAAFTPPAPISFADAKKKGLAAFVAAPTALDPTPIGPPGPPAPAPATSGPAPKAGSALLGAPAPKQPLDVTNFGKTKHEVAAEKQESKHLINQLGFQNQQSSIEAEQADAFAATATNMAIDADKRAHALEVAAAKRKAFLERFNSETESKIDDYVKSEVDPNRHFAKVGQGGLFMSMVGVALSGAGQMFKAAAGMDPGRNGALDMIEKTIQQDIELQKAQIAKKGAGIEARRGLYASYLQQFGSEDAAEAMAYEAYLRKAKATVDAQMAKTTSKEVKLRGEALGEALENRIIQFANGRAVVGEKMYDAYQAKVAAGQAALAAEKKKRDELVFKSQLAVGEERAKKIGGSVNVLDGPVKLPNGNTMPAGSVVVLDAAGNIDLSGTEAAAKSAQVATVTGFNAKGQPIYGTGTAFSPDDKKKFDEGSKVYAQIKRDLKIIKDLREKHGGGALVNANDIAKANAAASRLKIAAKSEALYKLGQITGADTTLLEPIIPTKPLEVKAVGIVGQDPIGTAFDEFEGSIDEIYKNAEATHLKGGAEANTALPLTAPK